MFQGILLLIPLTGTTHCLQIAGRIGFYALDNCRALQGNQGREVFTLNQQRSISQGLQHQGRRIALKLGVCLVLVLMMTTVLVSMTTAQVHAATLSNQTYYTIVSGDTLSGIGSRFGVSVADLASANGIPNPDLIYAGQTIVIPKGTTSSGSSQQLSGSYEDMIHQVFGQYGGQAVRVAMCESSMNPNAYNGILGAAGLFQIIPGTFASTSYAGGSVYDPATNIRAAYEIFARDGYSWREWACQP